MGHVSRPVDPSSIGDPFGALVSLVWFSCMARIGFCIQLRFLYFQHHCKHCGQIFCTDCLTKTVNSGPSLRPSKVCDVCHTILVRDATPYFSTEPLHTPEWENNGKFVRICKYPKSDHLWSVMSALTVHLQAVCLQLHEGTSFSTCCPTTPGHGYELCSPFAVILRSQRIVCDGSCSQMDYFARLRSDLFVSVDNCQSTSCENRSVPDNLIRNL